MSDNITVTFTYQELVSVQEYYINHKKQNKSKMDSKIAVSKISSIFKEERIEDRLTKGILATCFLLELDQGIWQLNDADFTHLKCSVKLSELEKGTTLNKAIIYSFIKEG